MENQKNEKIEKFKEFCRDNGKYNLDTLEEIAKVYDEFEREEKSNSSKKVDEDFEDLRLDL